MFADARNHQITAANNAAATACSAAMESYLQRKTDTVAQLQSAIEQDPECALAHATLGLMLHGAKHKSLIPDIGSALQEAIKYRDGVSAREKLYVDALECAASGKLHDSVSCYENILQSHPTDAFALSLLQSELFWLGDMDRSVAASGAASSHWHTGIPGYSEFLAIHAFDLEEAGLYKQAETVGRQAVELNSANIWATHAVAHVLYMQGRHDEGVDWIGQLQGNWEDLNQIRFHLWWHKCLFQLEQSDHDVILDNYDTWVRNREHPLVQSMPDLYIDLQNGASMLWRLELAGINTGNRWNEMAQLVTHRVDDLASPFTSAHFAVILAAVGDFDSCDRLVEAMTHFAHDSATSLAPRYEKAAIPAAKAAIAHRRGQYRNVVELLMPARHDLWMMGGSHAQQDLFFQMLVHSAAKIDDTKLVASLLVEIEKIGFVEPLQSMGYQVINSTLTNPVPG